MKVIGRVGFVLIVTLASLVASTGTSHATVDNELSVVDGKDRTLTIQQWDTHLEGVAPMDRNRLTREWFHSGRAKYTVEGPKAKSFRGKLELGYQIGFPWSMGVGMSFRYTTPNVLLDNAPLVLGPLDALGYGFITTPNLFPGATISADLGNGPGIQDVATFAVNVKGPMGAVAVSNAHGTVTGAAGGVMLRPYARLISADGDSVTTYGEPWNMN